MIVQALLSLRPGAHWTMDGDEYEGVNWHDPEQEKPTKEEVLAEVERLQGIKEQQQYKEVRAKQYPALADQLDMLWHAMDAGTLPKVDSFYDAIKAVKDANPKP